MEDTIKITTKSTYTKMFIVTAAIYGTLCKKFGMEIFHNKNEKTGLIVVKPISAKVEKRMKKMCGEENFEEAKECNKCHNEYGLNDNLSMCPRCETSL